jgi:hypothetical protein
MLQVNGATLEGGALRTDAFDVVVDEAGRVSVLLLAAGGLHRGGDVSPDAIRNELAHELFAMRPMKDVAIVLKRYLAARAALRATVALGVARFSPIDGSIELLNAGLPPILRMFPTGSPLAFAARSPAIGAVGAAVHPYELAPLGWGSLWVFATAGATPGLADAEAMTDLGERLRAIQKRGVALTSAPPGHLRSIIGELLQPLTASDATLVLVGTNPNQSPAGAA